MDALKVHFRPEFLNRIDEVIVFHELNRAEVLQMVDNLTRRLTTQLEGQGLGIELTQSAKELLAVKGYDPHARRPSAAPGHPAPGRGPALGDAAVQAVPRRRDHRRRHRGRPRQAGRAADQVLQSSRASCRRPPSSWRRPPRRARTPKPRPGDEPAPSRAAAHRLTPVRRPATGRASAPASDVSGRPVASLRSAAMRFSVWPTSPSRGPTSLAVATHAEATGWDGVYVADHFMGDGEQAGGTITPMLEATAALAGAGRGHRAGAPRLARVRHHLPPPGGAGELGGDRRPHLRRSPAARRRRRLAGATSTSSTASSSARRGVRIDRFDEALRGAQRAAARRRSTTVDGEHYRLTDAVVEPKPVQDPLPILIGGKGDRMLGVVARYADEWNMWALPDRVRRALGRARRGAARRSTATRRRSPARARRCGSSTTTRPRPTR